MLDENEPDEDYASPSNDDEDQGLGWESDL